MSEHICPHCETAFSPKATGRPPTFCSAACRVRNWQRQNPDQVRANNRQQYQRRLRRTS